MLFGSKILFLHVPRTAGTSVTQFLVDNIPERLTLVAPSPVPDRTMAVPRTVRIKTMIKKFLQDIPGATRVNHVPGIRHERLTEAARTLSLFNRKLTDFDRIIAVMRNPYDLEVSRYHFLRLGYHGVRGLSAGRAQDIALKGDFAQFCDSAPYLGRLPARIEDWFALNGTLPQNLCAVRFESLSDELPRIVGQFHRVRRGLPRLNTSEHEHYRQYLTAETEAAIYRKFRWLFDSGFYKRETVANSNDTSTRTE